MVSVEKPAGYGNTNTQPKHEPVKSGLEQVGRGASVTDDFPPECGRVWGALRDTSGPAKNTGSRGVNRTRLTEEEDRECGEGADVTGSLGAPVRITRAAHCLGHVQSYSGRISDLCYCCSLGLFIVQ